MVEQKNAIIYSQPQDPSTYLESKKMDIESGWLGKAFGTGANCCIHIAGLLAIMLLLSAVLYTLLSKQAGDITSSLDFWKYVFPLLGTVLGYLFGKNQ